MIEQEPIIEEQKATETLTPSIRKEEFVSLEAFGKETDAFENSGWRFLFYTEPGDPRDTSHENSENHKTLLRELEGETTTEAPGTMRTYACTAHSEPGVGQVPWFVKIGNEEPPENAWGIKFLVKVVDGERTIIEEKIKSAV